MMTKSIYLKITLVDAIASTRIGNTITFKFYLILMSILVVII